MGHPVLLHFTRALLCLLVFVSCEEGERLLEASAAKPEGIFQGRIHAADNAGAATFS